MSKLSASFKNIEDIKAAFKLLDVDGDGAISRQEMSSLGHKFSPEQVDAIFALGDVNDDGAIGNYQYSISSLSKYSRNYEGLIYTYESCSFAYLICSIFYTFRS